MFRRQAQLVTLDFGRHPASLLHGRNLAIILSNDFSNQIRNLRRLDHALNVLPLVSADHELVRRISGFRPVPLGIHPLTSRLQMRSMLMYHPQLVIHDFFEASMIAEEDDELVASSFIAQVIDELASFLPGGAAARRGRSYIGQTYHPQAGDVVWSWLPEPEVNGQLKARPMVIFGALPALDDRQQVWAIPLTSRIGRHDDLEMRFYNREIAAPVETRLGNAGPIHWLGLRQSRHHPNKPLLNRIPPPLMQELTRMFLRIFRQDGELARFQPALLQKARTLTL